MKKVILLVSVIALVVSSCSSDNSPVSAPVDESGNVLLKKTITTQNSAVTTDVYAYNGFKIDKITSADGVSNKETKFTYTGDFITKIEVSVNTILKSKKEYTYQNDKLTQIIAYDYNGTQTTKKRTNYVHGFHSGTIESAHYETHSINMSNNQETLIADGDIEFSGRAIDNQLNTDYPATMDSWAQYDYDAKHNPTRNIIGYDKLLDNVVGTSLGNMANIKLEADAYVNGVLTTVITNYKRTYKYNDLHFPYERKTFTKNATLDYTTQYFYE